MQLWVSSYNLTRPIHSQLKLPDQFEVVRIVLTMPNERHLNDNEYLKKINLCRQVLIFLQKDIFYTIVNSITCMIQNAEF